MLTHTNVSVLLAPNHVLWVFLRSLWLEARLIFLLRFTYSCYLHSSLCKGTRCSCFNIVTHLRAGRPGFDSRLRQEIFFSLPPPIQWVPGAVSPEMKRPGREAEHSSLSSAEIKNAWRYTSTLPIRLHGMVLS